MIDSGRSKRPKIGNHAEPGRCGKWNATFLVVAACILLSPAVRTQERAPEQLPQFHLIQVVDPGTFLEKINEAAAQGYRLVATTRAAGNSLSAIMERAEDPSKSYKYLSVVVGSTNGKFQSSGKLKAEALEQLNAAGARGYGFHLGLGLAPHAMLDLLVLESISGSQQSYDYVLIMPGAMTGLSSDEISRATGAGYHWACWFPVVFGNALIFERAAGSSGSAGSPQRQPMAAAQVRFKFLQSRTNGINLPENQLHKFAAKGGRVVDFFGSISQTLAMEETVPPSAPYEYTVLKTKNLNSPLSLQAKMSRVEAEDLTRAGQQGFRMLRLSATAPPFVMEKAPGSVAQYEYRFASSPRLPDLVDQLTSASQAGFHVAKMESVEDGFLVIMEKSDAKE